MSSSAYIGSGAILCGRSAYLIARVLPRNLVDVLQAEGYREAWIEEAVEAADAIDRASAAWVASRRAATELRSAQPKPVDEARSSSEMTATVSTAVAAADLEVSARRVLQLVDNGTLPAVREGRAWRIDRAAVADQAALRRARDGVTPGRPSSCTPDALVGAHNREDT